MSDPLILSPAPGLPAFVEDGPSALPEDGPSAFPEDGPSALPEDGGEGLEVWLAAHAAVPREDVAGFAAGLALAPSHSGGAPTPLALGDLAPVPDPRAAPAIAAWAALPGSGARACWRARLRPARPLPGAGVRLFDLVREGRRLRRRCVAAMGGPDAAGPRRRLSLAFASDLHVAALWDEQAAMVARQAPDLAPGFLHPERILERFVAEANRRAARGELDLVVLGGDLVDHVVPGREGNVPFDETNVARLLRLLEPLRVPSLALAGNHDHRLHPWRPRAHGLGSAGVPPGRLAAILRAAGRADPWPVHPADRRSLATRTASGTPALSHHLRALSPATDAVVRVRGATLVLAHTGRDVVPRWRKVEAARWPVLLRSLATARHTPDSEGLSETQARAVSEALREGAGALFLHAPLLHARPGRRAATALAPILDHGDDGPGGAAALERRLFATGLRHGVAFRNPVPVLRALTGSAEPPAVFSGHVHHATALDLDRETRELRRGATDGPAPEGAARLLGAPSLAQRTADGTGAPGWIHAVLEEGRLVHTTLHASPTAPVVPDRPEG